MGQFPLYKVSEDVFPKLGELLGADGLELVCVEPQHLQRNGKTLYRGWEVRGKDGAKAIMWDKVDANRSEIDRAVELTVGVPDLKRGRYIYDRVDQILVSLGANKLA